MLRCGDAGRRGVCSWSLDLISGLPDLGREQWRHSLQRAIAAGAPHISVYDLQACAACAPI